MSLSIDDDDVIFSSPQNHIVTGGTNYKTRL